MELDRVARAVEVVLFSEMGIGCMIAPGFAMARPDAASAEARPFAALALRLDFGDVLVENVDDVESEGIEASLSFSFAEERCHGRRFFVPPTEYTETESELSGTSKEELVTLGIVALGAIGLIGPKSVLI